MNKLARLDNWRSRLAAELDRQRRSPFVWGEHDCASGLVVGAIRAMTGVDLAADYRGAYSTSSGALALIHEAGAKSLGDFAAMFLPEIPPPLANIGDVGVIRADGSISEALCIFDASGVIVMTDQGHGRRARSDVIRAFKVG